MRKFNVGTKVQVKRTDTQDGGIYAGLVGEVIAYFTKRSRPYLVRLETGAEARFRASDLDTV